MKVGAGDEDRLEVYPADMRLFVAILLEPPLTEALRSIQARLRRLDAAGSVRWVDPAGVHLTLKFLGEVEEEAASKLTESLDQALLGLRAPTLGIGGLGAFPSRRRPRVLWVGIREEGAQVVRVQARVEAACSNLGWEREKRVFQPHLTVGRVREEGSAGVLPSSLLAALDGSPEEASPTCSHRRVALMRSHLSPKGARYEELRVWSLRLDASTETFA